jgi:ribosomal protein L37AE/L43A
LTKYFSEKNRFIQDRDTPISVPNYEQIEIDSHTDRYCPYCQFKLSSLIDSSGMNRNWYCSKCTISYPDKAQVKSKARLGTPQKSNNERPAVSYPPEVGLPKKDHSIKGGLAELARKGSIKITHYTESKG